MAPEQNDRQIDKVLQAFHQAAPPDGMEARIATRLQHQAAAAIAPTRAPSRFAGCTPAAAWCRGAITGATAAVAVCAALFVLHRAPRPSQTPSFMTSTAVPRVSATDVNLPVLRQVAPCNSPAVVPWAQTKTAPIARELQAGTRIQAVAPSHPAPALPLTAQERQLVRLVRTASPAELAVLNPEIKVKRDAEKSAEFAKFFPPPPAPESNPDANTNAPAQVNE